MLYRVACINLNEDNIDYMDLEGPKNITPAIISEWEKIINEKYKHKNMYSTVIAWSLFRQEEWEG